jgi:UDP:flavonoid glycosyltransferase YjiC (YdhE family)
LTGFPLYDERDVALADGEWREFLDDGEAPIVFTPGSANVHGREFFAAAAEACQLLGRRGMLLTRYADQIPGALPPGVRHFSFAPFSAVLPRAAALVHHGGIGTLSQALAAGTPQLIMPLSHDQPDNAQRVQTLGVGRSIAERKFTAKGAADALKRLLSSSAVARNCRAVAEKLRGDDSLERTCDLVERLAGEPAAA